MPREAMLLWLFFAAFCILEILKANFLKKERPTDQEFYLVDVFVRGKTITVARRIFV